MVCFYLTLEKLLPHIEGKLVRQFFVKALNRLVQEFHRLDAATIPGRGWDAFVKATGIVFLAYWLHLAHDLNDWLGAEGFHLPSPVEKVFQPLPQPEAQILWGVTFLGGLLLLVPRAVLPGSLLAGGGFFYATMCDQASIGALNMHFLFALAVIFWSTSLREGQTSLKAWPTYLIRTYLVVVYFGSGWRKAVYGNWLDDPHALLHCITGYFTTNLTCWLYQVAPSSFWTGLQYLTVGFELGAPLLLLYPPLRRMGALVGCMLHIGIALLMKDLFFFSFQMLTFYIPVLLPTRFTSRNENQSAT